MTLKEIKRLIPNKFKNQKRKISKICKGKKEEALFPFSCHNLESGKKITSKEKKKGG